jgi:branched-chain amino acid transport system substrate-binding protein
MNMFNRRTRIAGAGMSALMFSTALIALGGGAQAGAASTTGVTSKTITVGGLIEASSATGTNDSTSATGAKAYFNTLNAHGGINGRKIVYAGSETDFGTPTKDLTAAKTLVEDKHVFAVVPVATPALASGGTYLVSSKVPFFGWGVEPSFCNDTIGFGFSGCLVPSAKTDKVATTPAGLLETYLKKQGTYKKGETVALIADDTIAGSFGITVSKAAFVADGFDVVYSKASIPSTGTTNYAPYVSTILKSATGKPPAIMYYVTVVPQTIGMSDAMESAGYKGLQLDPTSYTPNIVNTPSTDKPMQGHLSWTQFSPSSLDNASVKAENKAYTKLTGKSAVIVPSYFTIGYLSAALFSAIAEKAGKNLTRTSFLKAANSGKFKYGITGLMGTVTYPTDHTEATPCGAMMLITGKSFKPEVPITCYSDTPLSTATK